MIYVSIACKLLLCFILLIVSTRLMGKKNLSEATPFDFAFTVMIAGLFDQVVYTHTIKWYAMVYAFVVWTGITYLSHVIIQRFQSARPIVKGEPMFIIHEGKINIKAIDKANLEMEQVLQMLRQKGIFSVREVEFAIIEVDGQISVRKKSDERIHYIPTMVIEKGEILADRLHEINLAESSLFEAMNEMGVYEAKDIYYAEWSETEGLFIAEYTEAEPLTTT